MEPEFFFFSWFTMKIFFMVFMIVIRHQFNLLLLSLSNVKQLIFSVKGKRRILNSVSDMEPFNVFLWRTVHSKLYHQNVILLRKKNGHKINKVYQQKLRNFFRPKMFNIVKNGTSGSAAITNHFLLLHILEI